MDSCPDSAKHSENNLNFVTVECMFPSSVTWMQRRDFQVVAVMDHRYCISVGTGCHFDWNWKGKNVQEEHSRNARGPVYQTLGCRPNENALRETQLPLLRRKASFST